MIPYYCEIVWIYCKPNLWDKLRFEILASYIGEGICKLAVGNILKGIYQNILEHNLLCLQKAYELTLKYL